MLQRLTKQCIGLNGIIYLGRYKSESTPHPVTHASCATLKRSSSQACLITWVYSILLWRFALDPLLQSLLAIAMGPFASPGSVDMARTILTSIYTGCWLVPVYMVSFGLSCKWCEAMNPPCRCPC